jgi:endonuclease/exonuclease/phosphatase family metal-dependent hydrolase
VGSQSKAIHWSSRRTLRQPWGRSAPYRIVTESRSTPGRRAEIQRSTTWASARSAPRRAGPASTTGLRARSRHGALYRPAVALTLVSWNLKGSEGSDTAGVVDHITAAAADVVVLQEVQCRQARRIARSLGAHSWRWGFKHWPIGSWPEGMAVIGVTRPARVRTRAISRRWALWSWRRRIVQIGSVEVDPGRAVTLVNVHLSPHPHGTAIREVEAALVLRLVAEQARPAVVAGDFNDRPGAAIHGQLAAGGLRDAWRDVHAVDAAVDAAPASPEAGGRRPADVGATNWRGWARGTPLAPSQRLDYVLVSAELTVVSMSVPRYGQPGFERFATLSDHLPLNATVAARA